MSLRPRSIAAIIVQAIASATSGAAIAAEPFPSLDAAMERARARTSGVVEARGAVRAARALESGARAPAVGNPYLEVFADRSTSTSAPEVAVASNLWLPVELSSQRRRRIDEVDRLADWRSAQLGQVALDSGADALRRYGAVLAHTERARFLETIVATSQQEAALYQARVQAGDAIVRDAQLAAVDLSRNRMALEEARGRLARELADLAMLIGATSLSAPSRGDEAPPRALFVAAAVDPERLLDESPALRALGAESAYYAAVLERQTVETQPPVSVIISAGRGIDGIARIGGGLAWTFPLLHRNQGERARAAAERQRALDVALASRSELLAAIMGVTSERTHLRSALDELRLRGEPAAAAALEAALAIERAGKGELLHVVTARRDLISVRASGLALEEREWALLAELVALTGRSP